MTDNKFEDRVTSEPTQEEPVGDWSISEALDKVLKKQEAYRRENPDGTSVKVDSDPKNDYQDGYNAGRRYGRHRRPGLIALGAVLGAAATALGFVAGYGL